ncbi:MAG: hypothetical protein AB1758_30140 [Candidatus Eremiobacterota bacterium]
MNTITTATEWMPRLEAAGSLQVPPEPGLLEAFRDMTATVKSHQAARAELMAAVRQRWSQVLADAAASQAALHSQMNQYWGMSFFTAGSMMSPGLMSPGMGTGMMGAGMMSPGLMAPGMSPGLGMQSGLTGTYAAAAPAGYPAGVAGSQTLGGYPGSGLGVAGMAYPSMRGMLQ